MVLTQAKAVFELALARTHLVSAMGSSSPDDISFPDTTNGPTWQQAQEHIAVARDLQSWVHANALKYADGQTKLAVERWKEQSFWPVMSVLQGALEAWQDMSQRQTVVEILLPPMISGSRQDRYRKGHMERGVLKKWGIRTDYSGCDLRAVLDYAADLPSLVLKSNNKNKTNIGRHDSGVFRDDKGV